MKGSGIPLFPANAHGDDAYFLELSDNPGCYFHPVKRLKNGDIVYTIRRSVQGAAVFKKSAGEELQRRVRHKYPNTKLTPLSAVIGNKDGSKN